MPKGKNLIMVRVTNIQDKMDLNAKVEWFNVKEYAMQLWKEENKEYQLNSINIEELSISGN
jgi:hypothetical protein